LDDDDLKKLQIQIRIRARSSKAIPMGQSCLGSLVVGVMDKLTFNLDLIKVNGKILPCKMQVVFRWKERRRLNALLESSFFNHR
jgi:hypothetical protein